MMIATLLLLLKLFSYSSVAGYLLLIKTCQIVNFAPLLEDFDPSASSYWSQLTLLQYSAVASGNLADHLSLGLSCSVNLISPGAPVAPSPSVIHPLVCQSLQKRKI